MERSNLGKGLRLYFLGQVFALISIEGMTLALIPLMAAVMNSAFQLERQWTVYMPYGAKEMEAMTLSPDVLVPYALLTLLLGIVMLVCDIVSLVALVKLRREHPLYRRALFLTLVAAGIQILTALLQWEGIFVSAAWLAIACAATVFFLQGTNDILIQRTGELEARYNTLALRGRVVPWIYVICTVLTWLLAWGVESYTMAAGSDVADRLHVGLCGSRYHLGGGGGSALPDLSVEGQPSPDRSVPREKRDAAHSLGGMIF